MPSYGIQTSVLRNAKGQMLGHHPNHSMWAALSWSQIFWDYLLKEGKSQSVALLHSFFEINYVSPKLTCHFPVIYVQLTASGYL